MLLWTTFVTLKFYLVYTKSSKKYLSLLKLHWMTICIIFYIDVKSMAGRKISSFVEFQFLPRRYPGLRWNILNFEPYFFSHPVCTLCMVLSVTTSHRGFNYLLKNARTQGVDTRGCSEMANEFLDIISKSAKIQKPCSSNNFLRFAISFVLVGFTWYALHAESVVCFAADIFYFDAN